MIIKVPAVNATGKTDGCEKAPDAILKEIKNIFSNESGKEFPEKLPIEEVSIVKSDIEKTNQNIFDKAKEILAKRDHKKTIFLGGDHSISYALVKAFQQVHKGKNIGLLVFDAHADCVNSFKPPTHEDWLRVLIEEGFPEENIILVGLRNVFKNKGEREILSKANFFPLKELFGSIQHTCDEIMQSANKFDALYVSIDIDVVDPAFAPSVAYPEPGGLSSRELIYLIQRINLLKNIEAFDITEINSAKDGSGLTTRLGAKIVFELIE